MSAPTDRDRLLDLAGRFIENALEEGDLPELEEILRTDEEARRTLLSLSLLHEELFALNAAAPGEAPKQAPRLTPVPRRRGTRRRASGGARVAAWLPAAAAAGVALAVGYALLSREGTGPSKDGGAGGAEAIARVTSVARGQGAGANATLVRAGERSPLVVGVALFPGDGLDAGGDAVAFTYSGEATHIDLAAGASVLLSEREGAKHVRLDRGSLSADVAGQPAGRPMSFATPHAEVTVLGTRVAIGLVPGATRVEVAEGRVRLERAADGESVEVAAGERATAGAGVELVVSAIGEPPAPDAERGFGRTSGRPFADSSPWNAPIPADPVLDAESPGIARNLGKWVVANLYRCAVPIYDADERTPVRDVRCTKQWGRSPFEGLEVRVPDGARPCIGPNGWVLVIDWHARRTWEFGEFRWDGSSVVTAWGGHIAFDGNGDDARHAASAGASILAGTIREREIEAGRIEHALAFGSGFTKAGEVRYPGRATDGAYSGPGALPAGARIQLDPAVDAASIPGITRAELAIARALQRYGAYCIGKTEPSLCLSFEIASDAASPERPGSVYVANGLEKDACGMVHIPWERLRVLRRWNGE